MTIYIESFLLQNILINLALLRLVYVSLRQKTNLFRLILASIFGSIFSIIASAYLNNHYIINLLKVICASVIIIIAFKQCFKNFILSIILLFVYTFSFGGIIMSLAKTSYQSNFGIILSNDINLEAICLIIISISYIYEKLIKNLKFKIKSNQLIYKVELHNGKHRLRLNAFLDTGNNLNINGQPVLIVDISTYCKLLKKNLVDFYLEKGQTVSVATVSGASQMKLIKIDKLTLFINKNIKTYNNSYIAINNSSIFKDTNYQALLTPLFL